MVVHINATLIGGSTNGNSTIGRNQRARSTSVANSFASARPVNASRNTEHVAYINVTLRLVQNKELCKR